MSYPGVSEMEEEMKKYQIIYAERRK